MVWKMVKKKDPNRATKACPKPPGAHVPYARAPMSAKKPTLPAKIPILLGIGWLIFYLLYPSITPIFWPFDDFPLFLHVIITIVSFLAMGIWSFRASQPNERAIVGGSLVVTAAVFSLIGGSCALMMSHLRLSWTPPPTRGELNLILGLTLLVIGFFALICFALGLAAGIQSLRRKQFRFAMLGTSLLVLTGISYFLHGAVFVLRAYNGVWYYPSFVWGLRFGTPIVGLALLGLVFVVTGKQGFTPARNT